MPRLALAIVLLLMQMGPAVPNAPTDVQNPDYPLHARILAIHWEHNRYGTHGYGRGDLLSPQEQGFDYTFDCGDPFITTKGEELYPARWKKQNERIEILESRVGTDKFERCELKIDLKNAIYRRKGSDIVTVPMK
jgi:hypothetical protein